MVHQLKATEINTAAWKSRLKYRPVVNPVGAPRDKVITENQGTGDMRRTPAVYSGETHSDTRWLKRPALLKHVHGLITSCYFQCMALNGGYQLIPAAS